MAPLDETVADTAPGPSSAAAAAVKAGGSPHTVDQNNDGVQEDSNRRDEAQQQQELQDERCGAAWPVTLLRSPSYNVATQARRP